MAASLNNVKIAGVKLRWQRRDKDTEVLVDKEGLVHYTIKKLRRGDGTLVKDEFNRPQYQVFIGTTDEKLADPEPYLPCAKTAADKHFGEAHNGCYEGHWTAW